MQLSFFLQNKWIHDDDDDDDDDDDSDSNEQTPVKWVKTIKRRRLRSYFYTKKYWERKVVFWMTKD